MSRPTGLHPRFQTVTIPAERQPDVQRQPHDSIDFVLTPDVKRAASAAAAHLDAWRRQRNGGAA